MVLCLGCFVGVFYRFVIRLVLSLYEVCLLGRAWIWVDRDARSGFLPGLCGVCFACQNFLPFL